MYSKRDGTPSSTIKDEVKGNIAKERLHTLKEIVVNNNEAFRKAHNAPLDVLCESRRESDTAFIYTGLDQFFNPMQFESSNPHLEGQWVKIKTYSIQKERNYGEV